MKLKFPLATLAGVITWLLVALLTLYILWQLPGEQPIFSVSLLLLLFGLCFILLTQEEHPLGVTGRYGRYLLWLPLACAFALLWLLPTRHFDYLAILTIIWVCLLPYVMSQQRAFLLTLLVVASWFSLQAWLDQRSLWITASLYAAFHFFAVIMQSAILAEQEAKQALAAKNLELQSAQQLLLAASRESERLRIARDLHDLLGHHLTALTIQLQVASYQSTGDAKLQVDNSLQLARLLLTDVREAVSTLREPTGLNLQQLLKPVFAEATYALQLHIEIPPDLTVANVLQAQHLVMIVREAMSNTLKHAKASTFTISAKLQATCLSLRLSDNGKLAQSWQPGNGLTGIRERVAECAGEIEIVEHNGALLLQISLPREYTNAESLTG
ncbi:sensor histidine kinase [Alishewanella sp. d11]|uniref:sensor histidine kinase n=1 Tax=Alishewanella sp. d11 TaxID=3414030 RepID=UPI003BF77D6E